MQAYWARPRDFILNLKTWHQIVIGLGVFAGAIALFAARQSAAAREFLLRRVPIALALLVVATGLYALFLREPGGKLADYDAYALRTFAGFYVTVPIVLAAIAGYALFASQLFWRSPAFFLVAAAFGLFFFYKLRIVPEHFWAARRFVPVILPSTLILASALAVGGRGMGSWPLRAGRLLIGVVFLADRCPITSNSPGSCRRSKSSRARSPTTTWSSSNRATPAETFTSWACLWRTSTRATCWS
jgi:hypothetical protein